MHSLNVLQNLKSNAEGGRNTWQARQRGTYISELSLPLNKSCDVNIEICVGGQGEPFFRDLEGFEKGILIWIDFGRDMFAEKWGKGPCDLREAGLEEQDAWRVVKDWEKPKVQKQYRLDREKEAKEQMIKEKAKERKERKDKTSA